MMSNRASEILTPAAAEFVCSALDCTPGDICSLKATQTGMTNRTFRFSCRGKDYLLRIPGEGTAELISRAQEAACYQALKGSDLSDRVIALDPSTGLKLSVYWAGTRNCDPTSESDVRSCMQLLRRFHESALTTPHHFDLFGQIDHYEDLMGGSSEYPDYAEVKARCMALRSFLDRHPTASVLSHIDSVCDNFLFVRENDAAAETIHLIDWEYAGMHDPWIDLAMFAIYAGYNEAQLLQLAQWYLDGPCSPELSLKLRCYAALSGLLWSNWCEYKKQLGVTYGDYALLQYSYARDYSLSCLQELKQRGELS